MKSTSQIKQNDLLLKFLVFSTIIFMVLAGVLYLQPKEVVTVLETDENKITHFSDITVAPNITQSYLYGAKYIHDIEAYQQIKNLFFSVTFPQLTDKKRIAEALEEVKAEKSNENEFGKKHVYSTSYYIGNLLIAPNITLHGVLQNGEKPGTSILLDTALVDIRSGVAKIHKYFDVAPPAYYDKTYAGATYFTTASFPSLTVTEVAIVFYLLAELDPLNARLYEQYLHQYANQVLASGANFYLDIEYALYLASAYFDLIKETPDYKNLIVTAKLEWLKAERQSLLEFVEIKFPLINFPYASNFKILKAKVNSHQSKTVDEKLSGNLMLSLVDNRLPDPAGKMYQYNLENDSLLPFALDLQGRAFAPVGNAVANFTGSSLDKYYFVSGTRPRASESRENFFGESKIMYRTGSDVMTLEFENEKVEKQIQKNLKQSASQDRLLYNQFLSEQKSNPDSWDIRLDKLTQGKLLKTDVIARGASPVLVLGGEFVLFWREGKVWQFNTSTGLEQIAINLSELKGQIKTASLDFLENTKTLAISYSYLEMSTLEPKTLLFIYGLEKSKENDLVFKKIHEVEIIDASVLSLKQSPSGSYLAIMINETIGERNPRLLIFDINSGIIKKDLDLSPFSNQAMLIDDWLAPE